MRSMSSTIARLAALRASAAAGQTASVVDRLSDLPAFGTNPGALQAKIYVPQGLSRNAPLVVVLHGCTQTAAGYDTGSGWSRLADEFGFALLFPQQQRSNNPNLCFNWFAPGDARRDAGEAQSIRQMIDAVVTAHHLDRRRIHITGLSAGGAMAAAMLASYPEVFAGGAIIAGIPFGAAKTIPEAFARMRGQGLPGGSELERAMRSASRYDGPWPTLSLWHGSGDQTVHPDNADAILSQWRMLHEVAATPSHVETIGSATRRVWSSRNGREVIESFSIPQMGHGTPLDTAGPDGLGTQAAFMLDVGISSTRHIARFWGLGASVRPGKRVPDEGKPPAPAAAPAYARATREPVGSKTSSASHAEPARPAARQAGDVGSIIEDALRKAGLMK